MKFIFAFFVFCICSVIADDAPYPPSGWRPQPQQQQQRALLVLPPQYGPPAAREEAEPLDKVSEKLMERLRQEEGSDRGVYHVYLPDGRLQKVQYTTAPVKQQDAQPNFDGTNFQPQQAPNFQPSFNQYQPSRYTSTNLQTNHQEVGGNNQNSYQGNQQFNRYQSQQFGESRQQAYTSQYQGDQYLAPSASQLSQQNADKKEAESGDPSQLLAQYSQDRQNVPATSYVASVQFTDVPPISGPIFSYSPSPLVRIVRYANNYQ
uniref:Uncharacterized protein n=2 Tax=Rhodnius prolixus TaxID=13249 RepID=T1IG20_RHOPR